MGMTLVLPVTMCVTLVLPVTIYMTLVLPVTMCMTLVLPVTMCMTLVLPVTMYKTYYSSMTMCITLITLDDNVHDYILSFHDNVPDTPLWQYVHDFPLSPAFDDLVYMIRINYWRKQKWLIAISWHWCTLLQGCFLHGGKREGGTMSGVFPVFQQQKAVIYKVNT
jgi:hypothetical protein